LIRYRRHLRWAAVCSTLLVLVLHGGWVVSLGGGALGFAVTWTATLLLAVAGVVLDRALSTLEKAERRLAHTEDELRSATDAAAEANRSKSDFLSRVSHEMRTPLNVILGMTGLLRESGLSPQQEESAESIQRSGQRLLAVVEDLLDSSRLVSGQLVMEASVFSPGQAIEDVVGSVAPEAYRKGLDMALALSPYLPSSLRGDDARFRQILMGLVGNAVKFTERGQVSVRAAAVTVAPDRVTLCVEVTDTGVGINREDIERIFLPFVQGGATTTRRHGGTGLGLSIGHSLARSMGGSLEVESEPGRGSSFQVTIPFAVADATPAFVGTDLHQVRALLITENRTRRDGIERLLSAAGAEVTVARSAQEAHEQLARERMDVAILDTGASPVGELLGGGGDSRLGGLPTVLISSLGSVLEDPLEGVGAEAVLPSPVRQGPLLEAVRQAVAPRARDVGDAGPGSWITRQDPSHILLVDDHADNRAVVIGQLRGGGYHVEVAASGRQAVEKATRFRYDLILMDIEMPELDGFEAALQIRAFEEREGRERSPMVALTAHALMSYQERAQEVGMDDFATKPISGDDLRSLVARRVDRRPVVLVVEDAPDSRMVIGHFLEDTPSRVVFAEDAEAAFLELKRQRISAVLLDMSLPTLDGTAVASWIRAQPELRSLPVVAITGHTRASERLRCLAAGCSDYLPKPLRRQDVLSLLSRLYAGSGTELAQLRLDEALVTGEQDLERVWRERLDKEVAKEERLSALWETGLLDSAPEADFDLVTQRIVSELGVPVALVSLVDDTRQYFKSAQGLGEPWASLRQTPLSHSFCQHVVSSRQPFVVEDAREHPVVMENLAISDLGVIAYAGVPLRAAEGMVLGSLCAIDVQPRQWTEADLDALSRLAVRVEDLVRRRRAGASDGARNWGQIHQDPTRDDFARRFLLARKEELPRLEEWLEVGDFDQIARAGHQIKGTAATFGHPEIGVLGGRLEAAAGERDASGIAKEVEALRRLL